VRYRVEQLASSCDVSVDTVRYYQARGLLPQPEREGRVAWYGTEHAERIRRIRDLQGRGLTLAAAWSEGSWAPPMPTSPRRWPPPGGTTSPNS